MIEIKTLLEHDNIKELTKYVDEIYSISRSLAKYGVEACSGLKDPGSVNITEAMQVLIKMGGQTFANEYLRFLYFLNGFSLNGTTMYGIFSDEQNIRDIRRARANLHEVPELYPVEFDDYVFIGHNETDVVIFNQISEKFELRDRIGTVDTLWDSFDDIPSLLKVLIDNLRPAPDIE